MNTNDSIMFERIAELGRLLDEMRRQYAEEPGLFEIYSQPLVYELDLLRTEAYTLLTQIEDTADIWIGLKGEAFGSGSGPMEVVAKFLTSFRVAAGHAASAVRGHAYTGGRFLREVESAVAFDIVAMAPGSLGIGLVRSASGNMRGAYDEGLSVEEDMASSIEHAIERSTLGSDALQVLMLALDAAGNEESLAELRRKLDNHGALRVLYHARSLFPVGISSVEFSGRAVGGSRRFEHGTRAALQRISEELVESERYVSGIGVIRMLDLDRRTLRFEFVRVELFSGLDQLMGEFDESLAGTVGSLMNKPVEFSGFISFDGKGVIQGIRIDAIDPIDTLHHESSEG